MIGDVTQLRLAEMLPPSAPKKPRPKTTRYSCARCGVRLPDVHVYSHHTRNRYCWDIDTCAKRAARRTT